MNESTAMTAFLSGALIGGGIFLLIGFFIGVDLLPTPAAGASASLREHLKGLSGRLIISLGTGVVLLIVTRWIVLAGAGIALVLVWPLLFGGAKEEKHAAAKIEALATWAESLRDTIAGAVGLEQAIPATAYAAAPVIREDLALLSDRMRVRVPLPLALRQFADGLNDPTADLIVSALIMNARLRGPGLRQLLGALADTARSELDMRQRVSASRAARPRLSSSSRSPSCWVWRSSIAASWPPIPVCRGSWCWWSLWRSSQWACSGCGGSRACGCHGAS